MTYLELVNEVLRRLRERTVSTYTQTTYSTMVGAFINDAKRQIEHAWTWNNLRSIVSVSAVNGTKTYSLTGFGKHGKVLTAFNDTSNVYLKQMDQRWFDKQNYTESSLSGSPEYWCFRGEDGSEDSVIEVYPTPDDSYSLEFNCFIPQDELSADGTTISIPWRPVALLAVAMLAEEKGETGGTTSARYFEMADKAMADEIARDMEKFPQELNWYTV